MIDLSRENIKRIANQTAASVKKNDGKSDGGNSK